MDRWLERTIREHRVMAEQGTFQGDTFTPYLYLCRIVNPFRGVSSIFSRDTGYHTSGWWKNPDYERCYHLSVSFFDPLTEQLRPQDKKIVDQFLDGLFGPNKRLLWCESPHSKAGKKRDVWHYRLFCDEHWQPILPRGEVYSKAFTEVGWKSFSELHSGGENGTEPR